MCTSMHVYMCELVDWQGYLIKHNSWDLHSYKWSSRMFWLKCGKLKWSMIHSASLLKNGREYASLRTGNKCMTRFLRHEICPYWYDIGYTTDRSQPSVEDVNLRLILLASSLCMILCLQLLLHLLAQCHACQFLPFPLKDHLSCIVVPCLNTKLHLTSYPRLSLQKLQPLSSQDMLSELRFCLLPPVL